MSTRDILIEARRLIEPKEHWGQGRFRWPRICAADAIAVAAPDVAGKRDAMDALSQALPVPGSGIGEYNDTHSHAEVLALFDRAIAAFEEENMSAAEIKAELYSRWQDDPIVPLCVRIVDFVSSLPQDQLQMLTFRRFLEALGKERIDDDVMRALTILVSSRVAALDARGLLVDDDQTEHELSARELAEARASGQLVHPETGELVPEFESRVVPFFVPSSRLRARG